MGGRKLSKVPVTTATNGQGQVICNAQLRKRPGSHCQNPQGFRTDHLGQGRCYLHGGNKPIQSGRYSQLLRERMRDMQLKHEADPDPLNIFPEIAAGRMLFEDFLNRYAETTEALLAWHESYVRAPLERIDQLTELLDEYEHHIRTGEPSPRQLWQLKNSRAIVDRLKQAQEGKPRTVVDIASAHQLLENITRMVERVQRERSQNAISRANMLRVMTEFGRAVVTYVNDPTTVQRIKEAWLSVHL